MLLGVTLLQRPLRASQDERLVSYEFDRTGRLDKYQDGNQAFAFGYDPRNRLESMIGPNRRVFLSTTIWGGTR